MNIRRNAWLGIAGAILVAGSAWAQFPGPVGGPVGMFAGPPPHMARFQIRMLESLVKERPDDVEAHFHLGMNYLALGQKEQARAAMNLVVGLRPRHLLAQRILNDLGGPIAVGEPAGGGEVVAATGVVAGQSAVAGVATGGTVVAGATGTAVARGGTPALAGGATPAPGVAATSGGGPAVVGGGVAGGGVAGGAVGRGPGAAVGGVSRPVSGGGPGGAVRGAVGGGPGGAVRGAVGGTPAITSGQPGAVRSGGPAAAPTPAGNPAPNPAPNPNLNPPPRGAANAPVDSVATGLVGVWRAKAGGEHAITLNLESDTSFRWQIQNKDKTNDFAGKYSIAENKITLIRSSDNEKLVGEIRRVANAMQIRFAGGSANDPSIEFTR